MNTANGEQREHERGGLRAALTAEPAHQAAVELEADRALAARPAFGIRSTLLVAFALCFLLSLAPTVWSMHTLSGVQDRVQFLEIADDYMVEIQQARRFEKNYLLYGTNLDDALEHTHRAQQLVEDNQDKMQRLAGAATVNTMRGHLREYERLLHTISNTAEPVDHARCERELRRHGGEMMDFAQSYVRKERATASAMLSLAKKVPFVFLGLLLVAIVLVANFLTRRLIRTLSRFTEYAGRIGRGDFTPITPRRPYRDEFTQLALAFNHMIHELDRRQQVLVESHKLRALGTLVAGVAHEINNPLNNIMLTAGVLKEEFPSIPDDEKLEMVDELIGQTERSRKIVRNLLDFARESETRLETLDLRNIVSETVRLVGNQLKVKKIHLHTVFPETVPPVHGDAQLLSEVFMNLVINAVDVLPEKGELTITVHDSKEEGYVAVDVADNGPGIPDHLLARIFDPFFTTKPKGKGTGLGLSVSQGIVSRLGGTLRVSSSDHGATFTVLLPVTSIPSEVSTRAA
jgi:two-component system NtrC family sensor kinase